MRPPFFSLRLARLLGSLGLLFPASLTHAEPPASPSAPAAFAAAEAEASARLEASPNTPALLSRRGDLRLFLGRFAQAIADFERMIALDPTQDAPHWRLGIAYYFQGDFAKAARQFEKYHAYDGRDRENGIWQFLSKARGEGIAAARAAMLEYREFDREPFPALYELFAGTRSAESVLEHVGREAWRDHKPVQFFARYYVGVYEALTGKREEGARHVRSAVALYERESSGRGGPGYMWEVARLHAELLEREAAAAR
ncbi:MAG: Lipoprotein NlpI precursor [Verrucomicrobiota bacterium]